MQLLFENEQIEFLSSYYNAIGGFFISLEQLDSAEYNFTKGLETARELPKNDEMLKALLELCKIYVSQGEVLKSNKICPQLDSINLETKNLDLQNQVLKTQMGYSLLLSDSSRIIREVAHFLNLNNSSKGDYNEENSSNKDYLREKLLNQTKIVESKDHLINSIHRRQKVFYILLMAISLVVVLLTIYSTYLYRLRKMDKGKLNEYDWQTQALTSKNQALTVENINLTRKMNEVELENVFRKVLVLKSEDRLEYQEIVMIKNKSQK